MFRKECIIAMKAKYRIVAGVILCALLVTQLLVPVYAVENETAAAGSCSVVSSNYVIEAGSITEQVILCVDDEMVTVSRTSYSNNISVIETTQDGFTVTEQNLIDFEVLKQMLSIGISTRRARQKILCKRFSTNARISQL